MALLSATPAMSGVFSFGGEADAAHRVFLAGPFQGQALQGHEADRPQRSGFW
jgi:hypothetical protein